VILGEKAGCEILSKKGGLTGEEPCPASSAGSLSESEEPPVNTTMS